MSEAARVNERIATERMSRISKLIGNEDFRWFMRECVMAEQARQNVTALKMTTDIPGRERAVAVWNALEDIRLWPDRERSAAGKTLGHSPYLPVDFAT